LTVARYTRLKNTTQLVLLWALANHHISYRVFSFNIPHNCKTSLFIGWICHSWWPLL